ncbi:hypothetical protein SAMN05216201_10985 [Pseudomonas linyingensis]|uniref:Uncharacterized protein n=1 Tax=Pseudomonas linyingensis TaxID=915471 RepID=A0A1H6ZAK7_9PSED|nr:hypothetical protein [Pseudomonas linyingensis]SEJ46672.1 hypothetical protein SAMN05216201_10985 [Pseudomonas linyingensis]
MLPRSVQDQIDAAQRLQSQLNKPAEAENPADQATPEAKPQDAAPVDTAQSAEPTPPAQAETRDAAYWRHRFDVIQGKYNVEVPALRKEIDTLKQQIAAAPSAQQGSAVQRAQEAMADLTPEEIDEFGPDLVNLIKRVAGSAAAAQASKADQGDLQTIKSELSQLREEKQQDAEARFWATLEEQVPNFRAINANPDFLAWLTEIDPMSGAARQQLLASAQHSLDPYRVATIFRSFAGAAPKKTTIPDELVQPRQSRAAPAEPSAAKVWTRGEISQFYRDKASMPADKAAALEADIFSAQAQGRIR